jgi:hypothetical protein
MKRGSTMSIGLSLVVIGTGFQLLPVFGPLMWIQIVLGIVRLMVDLVHRYRANEG